MVIPLRKIQEMPHLADIFLEWRILRKCRPNYWQGQTFMCVYTSAYKRVYTCSSISDINYLKKFIRQDKWQIHLKKKLSNS